MFLEVASVSAISLAVSIRRTSMRPMPLSFNAAEMSSAASASPSARMMAARRSWSDRATTYTCLSASCCATCIIVVVVVVGAVMLVVVGHDNDHGDVGGVGDRVDAVFMA